jgi:hypothetical protein
LRTGRPQNEVKHGQKGMFEELYSDLPRSLSDISLHALARDL